MPLAPVARGGGYGEPLCPISSVAATRQGMSFQPPIFEVIRRLVCLGHNLLKLWRYGCAQSAAYTTEKIPLGC